MKTPSLSSIANFSESVAKIKNDNDDRQARLKEVLRKEYAATEQSVLDQIGDWWCWPAILEHGTNDKGFLSDVLFAGEAELLGLELVDRHSTPLHLQVNAHEVTLGLGLKSRHDAFDGYLVGDARGVRLDDNTFVLMSITDTGTSDFWPLISETVNQVNAVSTLVESIALHRVLALKLAISGAFGLDVGGLKALTGGALQYAGTPDEIRKTYSKAGFTKACSVVRNHQQNFVEKLEADIAGIVVTTNRKLDMRTRGAVAIDATMGKISMLGLSAKAGLGRLFRREQAKAAA